MMERSEQKRIEAERLRVIEEAKRAHAEKNTGTGRVEQEVGRVEAEKDRMIAEALREFNHVEYQIELEALQKDPGRYMTPATRRYFRKVWLGYAILTASFVIGIWGVTNRQDTQIRRDLNLYATTACKTTTRSTLQLFNRFVQTNIEIQEDALQNNLRLGEARRAEINRRAIKRFMNSKLPIRSDEECEQPILRP